MLLISFGTRPEYIKIKPVLQKIIEYGLSEKVKLVYTGQHVDLIDFCDLDDFFKDTITLKIPNLDNRLDSIISSPFCYKKLFSEISSTMIQGDTTSALAMAIASFHRKIKIIHLEAGLRTYDIFNPYPEEFNRQTISRISNINLCPTKISKNNLKKELVFGKNYIVGNTVLDNIKNYNISYNNQIIVTMHRRENHEILAKWFYEIENLANLYKNLEFIIPLHLNPSVIKHRSIFKKVKVVPPIKYKEFLTMLSASKMLITDSGGIQEEAAFLRKKTIVCRKFTERVEGLGKFSVLCKSPDLLYKIFEECNRNYKISKRALCPYGDGNSSEKIIAILQKHAII